MRLFVGLGNPGAKYANNRHNIGFMAVDEIARRQGFAPWRRRFQGATSEGTLEHEKVVLLRPATFMNESGRQVAALATSAFASGLSCGYEVCGVTGSAKQFSFNGPGAISTDLGLEKDTRITEATSFKVRFEMFNVFNHANFLSSSVIGNANSGQFGQATNTAPARVGQISAKFLF